MYSTPSPDDPARKARMWARLDRLAHQQVSGRGGATRHRVRAALDALARARRVHGGLIPALSRLTQIIAAKGGAGLRASLAKADPDRRYREAAPLTGDVRQFSIDAPPDNALARRLSDLLIRLGYAHTTTAEAAHRFIIEPAPAEVRPGAIVLTTDTARWLGAAPTDLRALTAPDPAMLEQLRGAGWHLSQLLHLPDQPDTFDLLRLLLALDLIDPVEFEDLAHDYGAAALTAAANGTMLCLTLPEIPTRTAALTAQTEAALFPGLRAQPGWRGAALSYRFIFRRLLAADADLVTVIEDDALLPPGFTERLAVVRAYLGATDGWDMFSGLIADVPDDLRVLRVDHVGGQTFVHVDQCVSMVFGIYTQPVMQWLADWDPDGRNVDTDTIDRHLQRRPDTRVVVTLPFLVGHRSDAASTLWDFANSEYDDLVRRSQQRLQAKVAAFQSGGAK